MVRAAFYVDGFNVYHSIDELRVQHYKWLDWWTLASVLIPSKSETLERVVLCTATKSDNVAKMLRHRSYVAALESTGVICLKGHFADEPRSCRSCGDSWVVSVEKQGDVNLAISLIDDAHNDVFDHCYLVTADGDQAATAKLFKARFPHKRLTTVVITGRSHNRSLLQHADAKITVNTNHLERALFPKLIPGAKAILRPKEYDPPGDS